MSEAMRQGLDAKLEAARAEVARIERAIAATTCRELGRHEWRHVGGRNCGCYPGSCCSIPVHECARCGDCDYGDNAEAQEQISGCEDSGGEFCETCQGNGEIVTDWSRYLTPNDGDKGDEAVAECSHCGGEGRIGGPIGVSG
jgi:hypothetical protein